jgi:hypothetical protein
MENLTQSTQIETALAKENITAQVIAKLKENYFDLKINGLSDKEGFKAVEICAKCFFELLKKNYIKLE